jgi:iron complex outermembrane receptor protein
MKFRDKRVRGVVVGAGVAAAALASIFTPAAAQTIEEGATESDEIIVTAQRRDEAIQDVPFSISAVGGEEIEALGGNGFETFANRVAGLQAIQTSPTDTQFFMRGVSSGALNFDQIQQSSTVGIYFSDAATDISASNPNFQLFDIDRVEVLRGPQGAIYGAGSMSGAVRIIPTRPDMEEFGVGFGTSFSQTEHGDGSEVYDATINLPIAPGMLAVRGLVYSANYGGFIDDVVTGNDDYDSSLTTGGRVSVRFQPVDRLSVDLLHAWQDTELDGVSSSFLSAGELRGGLGDITDDANALTELNTSYDFGGVTLTAVTGYLQKEQDLDFDAAALPTFFGLPFNSPYSFSTFINVESFSQEVRLQSDNESRLSWLVGAFYSQVDRTMSQAVDIPGVETALGFPAGPAFGTITDRMLAVDFETNNEQIAVFGELRFQVTDQLEVSVAGRYFEAERASNYDDRGLFIGGVFVDDRESTEDGFNPQLNLAYDWSEDNSVYFLASRGFRLGGPNYLIPPGLCEADLLTLGYADAPQDFQSDSLWNYEIGSKNRFADGRGVFNISLYHIDWTDIQSTVQLPCGYNFQQNLGAATVDGLEAELSLRITDSLSIRSSLTLADATLEDSVPQLGVTGGERTPFTPEVAATFAMDYTRALGAGELFVSADLQYISDRTTGVTSLDSFDLDEFTIASLRVGYGSGHWNAYVFANNLFDERAMYDRGSRGLSTVSGEFITYARPRTIGVTLRRNF